MSDPLTCDTSVLVAALTAWHPLHSSARTAVADRVDMVPAHVLVETYSVLTRLPAPHRIAPAVAGQVLSGLRRGLLTLPEAAHVVLITRLAQAGIRGGAVYDALVAATARHHDVPLLTADRRARGVYELVGVTYSIL